MASLKDRTYAFLRWSERYTKTDMVYLASGQFWSTVGQVASTVAVLALALIVARFLPKDVYGQYKYIVAIVALLGSFSLTGLGTAVFQSVARGFDGALHEGFWANIRWSAAVFLGAFGLAAYYLLQGNSTLAFGILIGGCLSPFLASANLSNSFLQAKKDFRRSALYFGVIETLVSVGALIITIFLTQNVLILAAVYFLSNTLATLWLYRRVVRVYAPDAQKTDAGTLSYGKHLSLMGILSAIAGNIDQVLLFHFVGPVELAVYNFAVAIPNQVKGLQKGLGVMVQTKFVNRPSDEIHAGMSSKIFWIFVSTLALVLVYILIAPYLYGILFPSYADAAFYSQIYIVSLLTTVVSPASSYLVAKKKVREQYVLNVAGSTIQIVFMVVGVITAGLLGLVIARISTRIVNACITYALYAWAVRRERATPAL